MLLTMKANLLFVTMKLHQGAIFSTYNRGNKRCSDEESSNKIEKTWLTVVLLLTKLLVGFLTSVMGLREFIRTVLSIPFFSVVIYTRIIEAQRKKGMYISLAFMTE